MKNKPAKKAAEFIVLFLQREASGGILLMLAATLAVIFANAPATHKLYEEIFHLHCLAWIPGIKAIGLDLSCHEVINDAFMAVFFFLVGLELKREILEGELSDPRNIMLPVVGAIGGMLLPAIIYVLLNIGDAQAMRGWAVPTATDIAFALGVLTLLGSRIPNSLKIFLTSLAIFDDLGAVLIIAFFYTSKIAFLPLAAVLGCVMILSAMNKVNVVKKTPYILVGIVMWYATLQSGVHATIAGVLLAMFIPLFKDNPDVSPLKKLERTLHPWIVYAILPLFAFANSGINLHGIGLEQLLHPVPAGIALGLFLGKQLGVFGLSFLAVKFKIAQLPSGINFKNLYGVSILCGIGFTMSLFVGGLAFHKDGMHVAFDERLGIILGSLISGVVGYLVLRLTIKQPAAEKA
ncbi:sodium/proton antiporter, NhaA family [Candidatus Electrothrix aarhusensis]|jgi:NhaA family Na+:H+ antiporter|uniref:Na(+)/H(+) antiporter NhaA n=1 Tax=Candidatus Electrothrix aarhusensis TaxID=1859131 RepID=A0A3S3QP93_9BACT|nr:sodium/proton antiporter, NhaA family [Candidatus Electrothrix aarhusensis]